MTISLARRQKLAAIAKAHDTWVEQNLAEVSSEFAPTEYPKPGSDYNQHNVDVDASGEAEDDFALMLAAVLEEPMTAAGDPDWDESEHPRGPDGKFIEDGKPDFPAELKDQLVSDLMEQISNAAFQKNIAKLKGNDYESQALEEKSKKLKQQLADIQAMPASAPKVVTSTVKPSAVQVGQIVALAKTPGTPPEWTVPSRVTAVTKKNGMISVEREDGVTLTLFPNHKVNVFNEKESTKSVPPPPAPKLSPSTSSKAGKPITAWTKTIYSGDYADGQVVAVKDTGFDAHERIVWDAEAKKFVWQQENVMGGWTPGTKLTKKAAYEKFKGEKTSWKTPAAGAMAIDDAPPPSADLFDEVFPGVSPLPTADSGVPGSSPQFKILPRGERGKSGDGYFAGNFWGRYGAAGLMMRNVDDQGVERYLLVQANMKDNPDTFGKWQLPGGAIEELETPEQGAAREVFEELGFDQDFLYNMNQRETHKVTFDVPGFGPWSYSNIAVDVPTMPEPKFDPYELGGAQWFTAAELDKMRKSGQIIKPLEANLDSVLAKFNDDPKVPEPTPIKNQPLPQAKVRPTKTPALDTPTLAATPVISQQSEGKKTVWTKAKFNTTTAYKTKYEPGEIVGFAKFGSVFAGGDAARIVWNNGKFTREKWTGSGWQYDGAYMTKKDALSAMDGQPFYKPPKGTMTSTNNDSITGASMIAGDFTITTTSSPVSSVSAMGLANALAKKQLILKPFSSDGSPFGVFKSSFKAFDVNDEHVGAIHENFDGTWAVAAVSTSGAGKHLPPIGSYPSKEQALLALSDAYQAALTDQDAIKAASAVAAAAPKPKKTPKLTAAQIEKQNGTVPKTLKSTQKSIFLKSLKEGSSAGFIKSSEPDAKKVFTALVYAVNKHNETQSPKLNYLQGLNVLDQVYGSSQKANVVAWLQTSEGKALAPGLAGGGSKIIPAGSGLVGVPSAYKMGTPKKNVPANKFRQLSNADVRDMYQEMYKNKPLTTEQRDVISDYISSSDPFNEPLRGKQTATQSKIDRIKELQESMRPLPEAITVWRGTYGLGSAINASTISSIDDLKKFEGAVIGDPAFLSTSFQEDASFSGNKFKLVINLPEGTPVLPAYVHAGSFYEKEKEILLAAGLQFRLDRFEEIGYGNYRIYATAVPEVKA